MRRQLLTAAWRGDGSERLWRTVLTLSPGSGYGTFALPLDRDRCADLVVGGVGYAGSTAYVLSGATGAPLWALTRPREEGPGVVSRPAGVATRRFVRTC